MLVPIVLRAPPVFVFIPPAVLLAPAALSRFMQFMALTLCLRAVASMVLNRFMESMLHVGNSALTAVNIVGMKPRHRDRQQARCQNHA
jgi:hypothetical protein